MNRPECQPWIDISDREALGESVTDEERRFQRAHESVCRACADEAAVWRSLDGAALDSVLDARALEEVLLAARRMRADETSTRPAAVSTMRRKAATGVAVAALAAAAVFALVAQRSRVAPPSASTLQTTSPPVAVAPPEFAPAEPTSAPLVRERRIATASAPSCRTVSPGATACLAANSEATTARLAGPRRLLDLVRGRVVISLAPQAPGTSFGVATPAGTVTAVGTVFSVEILANGETIARCERGHVVVQPNGSSAEQHLLAGEQLRIGDGHAPSPLGSHDRRRDLSLLASRDDRAPRGEKASEVAERDERPSARNEKSAGEPRTVEMPRAAGDAARGTSDPARATGDVQRAPNEPPATASPTPVPTAATAAPRATGAAARVPVRDLLGRARALRSQGAFREAADAYRAAYASDPQGAEGRTALVALGGLLLSELNDPAGALQAFDNYLGGSKGALAQEAEFGRIRALRALGRHDAEKAAIQSFLAAHPDGPDAQVLRRRLESMGTN